MFVCSMASVGGFTGFSGFTGCLWCKSDLLIQVSKSYQRGYVNTFAVKFLFSEHSHNSVYKQCSLPEYQGDRC